MAHGKPAVWSWLCSDLLGELREVTAATSALCKTYRLCELLGSSVTEYGVSRLLLLSRMVLAMGPGWGAVTHHSPKAGSCRFCSPTQHHNAASVPKNISGFFCSSVLVVSGFVPRSPQWSLTFGRAVFH